MDHGYESLSQTCVILINFHCQSIQHSIMVADNNENIYRKRSVLQWTKITMNFSLIGYSG